MPAPVATQNLDGDVLTLVPVRTFISRYRLILAFGLVGILLLGITLVAVSWWVSPATRVSSIQLSLGFLGAQDGQYPNQLPFSAEELIDPSVLRVVYDRHELQSWLDFSSFGSSVSISQSADNLRDILREYEGRLGDGKLAGPARQALEQEYRSRLRSAASTLFTLAWYEPGGRFPGVPAEVKTRVLADIPAVWAEQAIRSKQALVFASRLPGLNPRPPGNGGSELEAFAALDSRARAMEEGLNLLEKLPGALQAALPDGTTLIDLRLRLRAFREQSLPAVQESLLTRAGSGGGVQRLEQALALQLKFRENRAQSSKDRLAALVDTYRDFLAGRPGAPGLTETGEPSALPGGPLDEAFLSRLLGLAQGGADRGYLKKMLAEIEAARIQAAQDEISVSEIRQNLDLVRSYRARRPEDRSAGSSLQPPPPQEDRAAPSSVAALHESGVQLGRLLDSSRQLTMVISEGFIGRQPELFGITRGLLVQEFRPIGSVRLGLALLAWGVLGTFSFLALLLVYHRAVSMGRSMKKS
jgi:hypothetical protein